MKNATYFLRLFEHLNLEKQKIILRNIFSLQFVSEYNISIVKDSIIFDLYVSNVFYRFIFCLKRDDSEFYVLKKEMDRIKIFIIWMKNYGQSFEKYSFDILSNRNNNKIYINKTTVAPSTPISSTIIGNIKSVCASGKYKYF